MTKSAYATLEVIGSCELSREDASARVDLSRLMRRCSWSSGELPSTSGEAVRKLCKLLTYQYTTTTVPIHFHRPPSINNGTSTTTIFSPLIQALRTSQKIARVTAGCTMLLRTFRCLSSLKMIRPSFLRSMGRVYQSCSLGYVLESKGVKVTKEDNSTPLPKALTICL